MEDELVNKKGRYEFEVFLPNENIPLSCTVNEQFGFYLVEGDEKESKNPNSPISKFREMLKNPEKSLEKMVVEWRKKDGENFNPPEIEYLSPKDLSFMTPYFKVKDFSDLNIYHFTSEENLRDFLEKTFGEKKPKYLI